MTFCMQSAIPETIFLGYTDAAQRMGHDEKLLFQASRNPEFTPQFYLYQFRGLTITLGRHTQAKGLLNPELEPRLAQRLVRRATGGGAILHAGGICFSYITRRQTRSKERHAGPQRLKGKILEGLSTLGLITTHDALSSPAQPEAYKAPRTLGTWCGFEEADSDIIVQGKKMGGIAQRILKHAILLEGYLMLRQRECVWMDRMRSQSISFMEPVRPISLEEALGRRIPVRTVFEALRA